MTSGAEGRASVLASATPIAAASVEPATTRASWWRVVLLFAVSLAACVVTYLAVTIPGAWFPGSAPRAWAADSLTLTRGEGSRAGDELVVTAPDATGLTLVSVVAKFRSSDYPAVTWAAIGIPGTAIVRVLWNSDYTPQVVNSAPVAVEAGRPLPVLLGGDRGWVGNISGLALAIQAPLTEPVRIRGLVAKPMGAFDILGDRIREWLAFEGWTGTSINTIVGGADIQGLSLPALLAGAVALAVGIGFLLRHRYPQFQPLPVAAMLGMLFVAATFVLDARWTWNLARQLQATESQFGGKDARERYLAGDDAPLYRFIEKARDVLPAAPARVFVVADASYFRDRAAYHLYPHNVYFPPVFNAIPTAGMLRPGDWLVVYQRRGIQYNAAEKRLRWDDGQSVAAELKLVDSYGALFQIE